MKLGIDDDIKISTIQGEFNIFFPFLRLDFFVGDNEYSRPSSKKLKVVGGYTVANCRKIQSVGEIILLPEMSVSELENIFKDSFGLSVQVSRKSGNVWLETSHSNTWSLSEQNKQGAYITKHLMEREEKRSGQ